MYILFGSLIACFSVLLALVIIFELAFPGHLLYYVLITMHGALMLLFVAVGISLVFRKRPNKLVPLFLLLLCSAEFVLLLLCFWTSTDTSLSLSESILSTGTLESSEHFMVALSDEDSDKDKDKKHSDVLVDVFVWIITRTVPICCVKKIAKWVLGDSFDEELWRIYMKAYYGSKNEPKKKK